MVDVKSLTASIVYYSNIVGSSVMLKDDKGRVIAQFPIMTPNLKATRKEFEELKFSIAYRIVELWNGAKK